MRPLLRAALGLSLCAAAACGPGAAGAPSAGGPAIEPPARASAVASAVASAAPPAASVETAVVRPFQLVVELSNGPTFCLFGDALGAYAQVADEAHERELLTVPFILRNGALQRVGSKKIHTGDLEGVSGCARDRDTLFIAVTRPDGRTYEERFIPIEGRGSLPARGDMPILWRLGYFNIDTPKCGEQATADGTEPMSNTFDGMFMDSGTFTLGTSCAGRPIAQVVGRDKRSRIVDVPSGGHLLRVRQSVYLVVAGTLSRWEGERFSPKPLPAPGNCKENYCIRDLYEAPDGTPVILFEDDDKRSELLIASNGGWAPLRLDDDSGFYLLQGPNSLWAISAKGAYRYARPEDPKPGPVDVSAFTTDRARWMRTVVPPFSRKQPGPGCDHHAVVLYGFTKTTPADYDFPLTRKALKGHEELAAARLAVVEELDRKYLVALVPQYKAAVAIAKVIEKGVQGSKPQVVCKEPKVLREITFDWKTGAIVPAGK